MFYDSHDLDCDDAEKQELLHYSLGRLTDLETDDVTGCITILRNKYTSTLRYKH
jgi:hypothetical protein